jgi:hypothetical protein
MAMGRANPPISQPPVAALPSQIHQLRRPSHLSLSRSAGRLLKFRRRLLRLAHRQRDRPLLRVRRVTGNPPRRFGRDSPPTT